MAAHARGAVLLAEGEPRAALEALREAGDGWRALQARYDGARTRVLIGLARRAARRRRHRAARAGRRPGGVRRARRRTGRRAAGPARVDAAAATAGAGGLSPRELEVLRLVATGRTNHAIAAELVLSEKTVARHLSNIFAKLGLSSRSAATAYAYEHDLV